MLKNYFIVLNKYDSEKYRKLDRALITKSDKKTIAKQYLWNKLQEKIVPVMSTAKRKQQSITHNK
jgi:hypothetical protein